MPSFGSKSQSRLVGVHEDLLDPLHSAIELVDFTILEGPRTIERQREYVKTGVSQTMDSRHLDTPALAVDIAPWYKDTPHVRWPDAPGLGKREALMIQMRWLVTIGIIMGVAHEMDIPVTSGLDWDRDFDFGEHSFHDWPHLQLPKGWK